MDSLTSSRIQLVLFRLTRRYSKRLTCSKEKPRQPSSLPCPLSFSHSSMKHTWSVFSRLTVRLPPLVRQTSHISDIVPEEVLFIPLFTPILCSLDKLFISFSNGKFNNTNTLYRIYTS